MTELLNCPFCGGEAYLRDDVSHSTAYFIGCATEDCFGELHWGETEAQTVAAWNRRAATDAAQAREAALREAAAVADEHTFGGAAVRDAILALIGGSK